MAAGMAFAQGQSPSPSANQPAARRNLMRQHFAQMEQQLNLTDTQKQQAKSIFDNARTSAQPIRQQLRENHQALMSAAKTQNDSQIQQLSAKQGKLEGQLVAIRTEAFSKFYAMLTPEQRTKADQMHEQFRERLQNRVRPPTTG
jgi:Spy/CpxP family protein refolding chaperone